MAFNTHVFEFLHPVDQLIIFCTYEEKTSSLTSEIVFIQYITEESCLMR